ncbi:MAG: hypothetical protein JO307_07885 [Bryobacterales bacterium]|nr:hypothetical protein [Bryobacterales bacterium]MBV9397317.1 hypothetical protein [Bryobacterales bacterium]
MLFTGHALIGADWNRSNPAQINELATFEVYPMFEKSIGHKKTLSVCPQCGSEPIAAVADGHSLEIVRHPGIVEAHIVESGGYVDFNFTGTGELPGLMRLSEAIAGSRYRAVFVDLAGGSSVARMSSRDSAYLSIESALQQFPIQVIDVEKA